MNRLQQQGSNTNIIMLDYHWTTVKQDLAYVLEQEAASLHVLSKQIPEQVEILIHKIVHTKGKIVFSGCGKSGIVAHKLAATFSSLGIPAIFLHPTDALHGDLGSVQADDFFIVLSKSGTIPELDPVFSFLRNQQIESTLICCSQGISSNKVDLVIKLPFEQEACTLNLAPTSSSTLMMAFGDALAVVVSNIKGFNKNDYARLHPSGTLGKKLLFTVKDLMYSVSMLPFVAPHTPFKDLLFIISSKKLGVGIVVTNDHHLLGMVTDGDLRRACNNGPEVFNKTASEIMSSKPRVITQHILAIDALSYMEEHHITSLIVTEAERVIGLLHIHDIIKIGLRG
jgi:arabinose-5-phosphate isomerase